MATGESTPNIATVKGRKALSPRRDPYWQPIPGRRHAALGFRKTGAKSEDLGTWIARQHGERDDGSTGYVFKALAIGAHDDQHHAAQKAALAWLDQRAKGIGDEAAETTVKKLCADFAKAVETTRVNGRPPRKTYAHTLRLQYAAWIDDDKLGRLPLTKLTKAAVRDWYDRLSATKDARGKVRTRMSINREAGALRAALNWGRDRELFADDSAWRLPLQVQKLEEGEGRRDVYLSPEQRETLAGAAEANLADLMMGMRLLPARPGALSVLKVSSYDTRLGVVTFGKDKTAKASGRKLPLPPTAAAFFERLCKGKTPGAPLFARADGSAWNGHSWKRATKRAVEEAFKEGTTEYKKTTLYVLRHCSITDLLRAGVPATVVADWAGTSVAEIEKHYRQFVGSDAHRLEVLAAGVKL